MKIRIDQAQLDQICLKWKIDELSIFGSALREDFREDSDVDILVRFADDAGHSLLNIVTLKEELSAVLGREIDLVEDGGLRNPYRRDTILSTREIVYAR